MRIRGGIVDPAWLRDFPAAQNRQGTESSLLRLREYPEKSKSISVQQTNRVPSSKTGPKCFRRVRKLILILIQKHQRTSSIRTAHINMQHQHIREISASAGSAHQQQQHISKINTSAELVHHQQDQRFSLDLDLWTRLVTRLRLVQILGSLLLRSFKLKYSDSGPNKSMASWFNKN